MGYITLGINHTTAPVNLREQVAFVQEQITAALKNARHYLKFEEIAILSTCNRMEIYCPDNVNQGEVLAWLACYHDVDVQMIEEHCYVYSGADAVRHLMRVASGLDSMILGEPQILGQLKTAYFQAQEAGTVGASLNRLFQRVFSIAKQVRTQTSIGKLPISVAYAATQLARQIFTDLADNTALLIGAGETIQLVGRHLKQQRVGRMIVANRTLQRASLLADELNAQTVLLSDLPSAIKKADIIIASTASQTPVLGKGAVEKALKARKHKPILMVDIAVPRDIEPEVGELSDVFLYTVDDLRDVVEDNLQQRQDAAGQAEALIDYSLTEFMAQLRALNATSLLRKYREKNEHLCQQELQSAIQALAKGAAPEQVLRRMAYSLTNKMIHTPSIQLKKAAAADQHEQLEWAKELLGLEGSTTSDAGIKRALTAESS